jgi:signal transduction histidine kinase
MVIVLAFIQSGTGEIMLDTLSDIFGSTGFMPHGHCFLWTPSLFWTYVAADAVIAASYYTIPVALWYFVKKREDLPFSWIFVMFAVFVAACGTTHLISIWSIWEPHYWLDAGVKSITAIASISTAILLWSLLPQALAIPSHAILRQTNLELENEVTRRGKAEDELLKINQTLAERTAELEAVNRELESFSYSVAHDLRAPLRHIGGYSQLLLTEFANRDETEKRYLDAIIQSSARMGALVDDLLALSRTSRVDIHEKAVDLNAIVEVVRIEAKLDNSPNGIEWQIDKLPSVRGDAPLLQVVFTNLISNAVKFSRNRNQPVIKISARADGNNQVVVAVKDNGAGFDPRYQDKLFGVFQRLHRDDEFEGNGIGLATVRRIIERHGGRIWAESRPDEGATFFVALQIA